jgi:hypothetical protein
LLGDIETRADKQEKRRCYDAHGPIATKFGTDNGHRDDLDLEVISDQIVN